MPRLADVYDALDPDRSDLDLYLGLVDELGSTSVLDVGCGTGTFACLLVERGVEVIGLDPAAASLAVASRKPNADRVRWMEGDVGAVPSNLRVDLVTMTGNVAQVFVDDREWAAVLAGARLAVAPGGHLVFETRRPEARAWEGWTPAATATSQNVPGVGPVRSSIEVTDVALPLVSFRTTFRFADGGAVLTSDSTLRFRSLAELTSSLTSAGLEVLEVLDAPDRPGLEHVVVARPSRPGP